MEKIKVNNQVILMRKFVKQAKVHAINKLVKEVKKLQNRKGIEEKIQKSKRKAERYLEEIKVLKKIKPDDVSKLALSKSKNWEDVLKEKSSTLEERSFAILANYEAVQKEVKAFHSSNQNLVPKIPDLIKEMEQRSKLPKYSPKGANSSEVQSKIDRSTKKRSDESMEELSQVSSSLKKNNRQIKIKVDENCEEHSNQSACESDVENSAVESKTENIKINESQSKHKIEYKKNSMEYDEEISPVHLLKNAESDEEDEESCSDDENEIEVQKSNINKGNSTESEDSGDISNDEMEEDLCRIKRNMDKGKVDNKRIISAKTTDITHKSRKRKLSDNQNVKKVPDDEISTENYKIFNDLPRTLGKTQQDSSQNFKVSSAVNKTIAMLNLDDLEGLDEIPVNKPDEFEEEIDDDKVKDLPKQKKSNSFFLGRDSLDSKSDDEHDEDSQREKCTSFAKNEKSNFRNNFKRGFKNSNNFKRDFEKSSNFKKGFEKSNNFKAGFEKSNNFKKDFEKSNNFKRGFEKSNNFKRGFEKSNNFKRGFEKSNNFKRDFEKSNNFKKGFEKSNNFKRDFEKSSHFKRDFQKSPNGSQFSRESYKFKGERNSFKKDNFQSKNYRGKFQSRGNKFSLEDHRNFKRGNNFQGESFKKKSQESANKLYLKNEGNNSLRKDKVSNTKGNERDKPLHPSWEAKRKQKELTHIPFQGKRVVFDD